MAWFKNVFGFHEPENYEEVRKRFVVEEQKSDGTILLHTKQNDSGLSHRSFFVGRFETPRVEDLREQLRSIPIFDNGRLTFQHMVGDVGQLHRDPKNAGAVFQAASQFNALEMVNPRRTPEDGITNYVFDRTQGPICALSCPAGTVYRNYFLRHSDEKFIGQGGKNGKQLDLLYDLGLVLGNYLSATLGSESACTSSTSSNKYWNMKNGYALPINGKSMAALKSEIRGGYVNTNQARNRLRVAIHWDTDVYTQNIHRHRVAQVYCSALPIGYDKETPLEDWSGFAQIVLDATYEATLGAAAILAHQNQRRVTVFLTKVGGGVFANPPKWITAAIQRSLDLFEDQPLDVRLVHYGQCDPDYLGSLP